VSDMGGNVWEWTASWYDAKGVYRVLRGGAWFGDRTWARCAYRSRIVPDNFYSNMGLRVVFPGSISAC